MKHISQFHLLPTDTQRIPVRRDADAALRRLEDDVNRAFDVFWRYAEPTFPVVAELDYDHLSPRTDAFETKTGFEVWIEMPGIARESVEVSIADDVLTVAARKTGNPPDEGTRYVIRERNFGHVRRTVRLPRGLNVDHANATIKDGVLAIKIPKCLDAETAPSAGWVSVLGPLTTNERRALCDPHRRNLSEFRKRLKLLRENRSMAEATSGEDVDDAVSSLEKEADQFDRVILDLSCASGERIKEIQKQLEEAWEKMKRRVDGLIDRTFGVSTEPADQSKPEGDGVAKASGKPRSDDR